MVEAALHRLCRHNSCGYINVHHFAMHVAVFTGDLSTHDGPTVGVPQNKRKAIGLVLLLSAYYLHYDVYLMLCRMLAKLLMTYDRTNL